VPADLVASLSAGGQSQACDAVRVADCGCGGIHRVSFWQRLDSHYQVDLAFDCILVYLSYTTMGAFFMILLGWLDERKNKTKKS
jgi:hypothetical protein